MFVILAEAFYGAPHQTHLLANFSSIKPDIYHDPTCVVTAAEYAGLRVDSFVAYKFSEIQMAADLSRGVAAGRFQQLAPVSMELLTRIRNGVMMSDHTPRRCKNYLLNHK
jgi:hypothetical protein